MARRTGNTRLTRFREKTSCVCVCVFAESGLTAEKSQACRASEVNAGFYCFFYHGEKNEDGTMEERK